MTGRQEQLAAAYAHCAAIAARHGKSYHLATRLLTPDRRPAVHALYAAARTADDLVDVPGADPAGDLADWSRAVLAFTEMDRVQHLAYGRMREPGSPLGDAFREWLRRIDGLVE